MALARPSPYCADRFPAIVDAAQCNRAMSFLPPRCT